MKNTKINDRFWLQHRRLCPAPSCSRLSLSPAPHDPVGRQVLLRLLLLLPLYIVRMSAPAAPEVLAPPPEDGLRGLPSGEPEHRRRN
uniref:Uncharacterized protein n=1 Tax=Caenorhabditis japonica TaxID=281687 RepID=A0A8R1IKS7_CAEJA